MYIEFVDQVRDELEDILGCPVYLPEDYRQAISKLGLFLVGKVVASPQERRRKLIARLNLKFRVNKVSVGHVFEHAARHGVVFNFHQKAEIQFAFDSSSAQVFIEVLDAKAVKQELKVSLLQMFSPASEAKTIDVVKSEFVKPSKLRNDREAKDVSEDIILSALSAFVYSFADEKIMHSFFDEDFDDEHYQASFWAQLSDRYPALYKRNKTLEFVNVDEFKKLNLTLYVDFRDQVLQYVSRSYESLNNHGYLALWINPIDIEGRSVLWELTSDIILFGEKFDEVALKKGYFKPETIAHETSRYINKLDSNKASFHVANEGFTYKDTFVCSNSRNNSFGSESVLVLLQKNKRDETLIPCPSCRSHQVGGNSYPVLGVKSWECGNILCPDKSKYNRGKRYSFKSLLMQEAIDDELNEIPLSTVRSWSKDVQFDRNIVDAFEMAVRCYSLHGDGVTVLGFENGARDFGREISYEAVKKLHVSEHVSSFWSSPWFDRYIVKDESSFEMVDDVTYSNDAFNLIHGDARSAIHNFQSNSFDGAVTSPPYYNAREYSQWDNIYCYMYDMYNIALEVCRVIREGGVYLYNIFDYFDNEKTLAHSAMGNKRIPLSAYTVDAFRRAGLTLIGNITWDKGDIEGKRGFNAGNFSPYYQAPFNCWEHILVFVKVGSGEASYPTFNEKAPSVLKVSPVFKMVKGENIHGHTAPFPEELPKLLERLVRKESRILDPFGGSCTTARALVPNGFKVTCVERDENYCQLARALFGSHVEYIKSGDVQLSLSV